MFDNAEAKDLVEYLAISKPSVYEALDRLAERGLAVKRVTKPARYSAISPQMAVDLLMDTHKKSADRARAELENLKKETVGNEKEDALWTIYGEKNIEYKIRDLFGKATKQIRCMIGERYLPVIETIRRDDISLNLIVVSDDAGLEKRLRKQFPGRNAEIYVISPERFAIPPGDAPPEFEEIHKLMKVENLLELIVDDEELLMVPPFFSGTVSVLNTKNKGAVFHMKTMSRIMWKRLLDGDGEGAFPFPPPPFSHRKDRPKTPKK
jgi:HTH-type transcriptional regulator, sugar sensing transcriptional regulator